MSENFWLGMAIILFSGALIGSFPLPMKYSRCWQWENTWLVYSLVSLVILPMLLAHEFAPPLREIYRTVSARDWCFILGFGFLWGVSQTTFGLAIEAVGMAFAFAVVAGLACLSGSLVPLLVFSPESLLRPRGILLLLSIPILFLGLLLFAKAGRRRELEQNAQNTRGRAAEKFTMGLAICIFTGVFGSNINLGFAFSGEVLRRGLQLGASPATSTYPVWVLVLGAAFVPNLTYCSYLLFRRRTGSLFFRAGWLRGSLAATAMGFIWVAGIMGYGIGTTRVGKYGTSLGFALLIAAQILASNLLGILAGEWKSTSAATKRLLVEGVVVIVISVLVLNLGGLF